MGKLRPRQQEVVDYDGGRMGVSAVPGSGKTFTLARLAAKLVGSGRLEDDQEVLIVTLVNSAVDNFRMQVDTAIEEMELLPGVGYRVRTLHGLAYDIVRDRRSEPTCSTTSASSTRARPTALLAMPWPLGCAQTATSSGSSWTRSSTTTR